MMSARQLAPALGFPRPSAYAHHDAAAAEFCKHQLIDVQQAQTSTDVERLIALDEFGPALLEVRQLKPALTEFSEAIKLATQVLNPTDSEVAYVYLHRLAAEALLAGPSASEKDLASARASLDAVIKDSSGPQQTYYQHLEQQFVPQGSGTPTPQ